MDIEFEWDSGNLSKLDLVRKSGRKFEVVEMESVFFDKYKIIGKTFLDPISGEQRRWIIGTSNQNIVLTVIFVVHSGKIRIFNVWRTKGTKLKLYTDEKVRKLEA